MRRTGARAISLDLVAAYLVACLVIVIVPGPTVTLIIANSLRHGSRAGLLNMAGAQAGLAIMIAIVGIGLSSVIAAIGHWFDWVRLAGAAYLIWLGWKMYRGAGEIAEGAAGARPPRGGVFLQFLDPARDHATQIAIMGATAMLFAALSDSAYALLSGRPGSSSRGTGCACSRSSAAVS